MLPSCLKYTLCVYFVSREVERRRCFSLQYLLPAPAMPARAARRDWEARGGTATENRLGSRASPRAAAGSPPAARGLAPGSMGLLRELINDPGGQGPVHRCRRGLKGVDALYDQADAQLRGDLSRPDLP